VVVEADPALIPPFRRYRPEDACLNVGISPNGQTSADFYIMSAPTLNTFCREEAQAHERTGAYRIERVIELPLMSIQTLLETHCPTTPNFVSLDVEGWDLPILQSFDFERHRPQVMCVETLGGTEPATERKDTDTIDFMIGRGYRVYADTHVNTIFVEKQAWEDRSSST